MRLEIAFIAAVALVLSLIIKKPNIHATEEEKERIYKRVPVKES